MRKRINWSFFYCETCKDCHYTYWLDSSEENITEEQVHELLNTGMYYMERKVD